MSKVGADSAILAPLTRCFVEPSTRGLYTYGAFMVLSQWALAYFLAMLHGNSLLVILLSWNIALISVYLRHSWGPLALICLYAVVLFPMQHHPLSVIPLYTNSTLAHFALILALLVYTSAHYRYLGIRGVGANKNTGRAPNTVTFAELLQLPKTLLIWPILTVLAWWPMHFAAAVLHFTFDVPAPIAFPLGMFWTMGLLVWLVRIGLDIARWRKRTPEEHTMFLNDVVWYELRPELSHLGKTSGRISRRNRWRTC